MAEAMSIADREQQQEDKELLVKVEEEQSGNKGKNTYYYKLSNNNGQPEIKPLLINKKYKKITGKKAPIHFVKKKITS